MVYCFSQSGLIQVSIINTCERFRTAAVLSKELAEAMAKIIVKPDLKLSSEQMYLCKAMNTKLPLHPVDSVAEMKLFTRLML